jgi:hypothetical protein
MRTQLGGKLVQRPIVVQAGHGGELAPIQALGVAGGNQGVGIGGITHHQHADVAAGMLVHGLALHRENLRVGFQQILTFHTRTTGTRTHQQRVVSVLERLLGPIGGNHLGQQGEGAVVKFHDHALEDFLGLGHFQQLQDHGLIRAEHGARGDTKIQCIANLASGAGHGNAYGFFHGRLPCLFGNQCTRRDRSQASGKGLLV